MLAVLLLLWTVIGKDDGCTTLTLEMDGQTKALPVLASGGLYNINVNGKSITLNYSVSLFDFNQNNKVHEFFRKKNLPKTQSTIAQSENVFGCFCGLEVFLAIFLLTFQKRFWM